jgi:hypothetical protein
MGTAKRGETLVTRLGGLAKGTTALMHVTTIAMERMQMAWVPLQTKRRNQMLPQQDRKCGTKFFLGRAP